MDGNNQALWWPKRADASNDDNQTSRLIARVFKTRLLRIHDSIDENVPLDETGVVADALINADRDFDLLIIPSAHHDYAAAMPYATRRRWDYFMRYLANNTSPKEGELKACPWR